MIESGIGEAIERFALAGMASVILLWLLLRWLALRQRRKRIHRRMSCRLCAHRYWVEKSDPEKKCPKCDALHLDRKG